MNRRDLRKRYWGAAGAWVGCIYSTLYAVRPICEFLKETIPFAFLTSLGMAALLVGITAVFYSRRHLYSPLSYFLFALVFLCYVYGLMKIPHPEEKIHFIEYGILAYFLWRALRLDWKGGRAYVGAFVLTTLLGWADEGIQYLLPNRYYQTGDVFLNSMSGLLALILIFIFQNKSSFDS